MSAVAVRGYAAMARTGAVTFHPRRSKRSCWTRPNDDAGLRSFLGLCVLLGSRYSASGAVHPRKRTNVEPVSYVQHPVDQASDACAGNAS